MAGKTLVILTLKKHEKGIWIRRLVNSLEQIVTCDIKVHTVEEWLAEGWIMREKFGNLTPDDDLLVLTRL